MTPITIGKLRHRLRLEAPSRTPDGGGGAAVTWTLVAEVWAAFRPYGGSERDEHDGLKARISHEVWIRHRGDVRPDMRFVMGERVFEILAAIVVEGNARWLRCLTEERLG